MFTDKEIEASIQQDIFSLFFYRTSCQLLSRFEFLCGCLASLKRLEDTRLGKYLEGASTLRRGATQFLGWSGTFPIIDPGKYKAKTCFSQ